MTLSSVMRTSPANQGVNMLPVWSPACTCRPCTCAGIQPRSTRLDSDPSVATQPVAGERGPEMAPSIGVGCKPRLRGIAYDHPRQFPDAKQGVCGWAPCFDVLRNPRIVEGHASVESDRTGLELPVGGCDVAEPAEQQTVAAIRVRTRVSVPRIYSTPNALSSPTSRRTPCADESNRPNSERPDPVASAGRSSTVASGQNTRLLLSMPLGLVSRASIRALPQTCQVPSS